MKLARRRFLSFMGAAPLAAKAAAESATAQLIGLQNMPMVGPQVMASISGGMPEALNSTSASWKSKVMRFLAQNALPDWLEADIRRRNQSVGYIDPDIACKKSWSLNVKIATQRERNIQRARADMFEGPRRGMKAREFEEQFGVWI